MATRGPKRSRLERSALLAEVAQRTALPVQTVRHVLETFVEVVREALRRDQKVVFWRFGTFEIRTSKSGYRVKYKAALEFKESVRPMMEKQGVELNNEAVLLAKVTGECPDCKEKLVSKDPPNCPKCGSRPFEKK